MSDGYTEGMLLSDFLSGQSPVMGDASTRKDEGVPARDSSPSKFFEKYNLPRIEHSKLLEVA